MERLRILVIIACLALLCAPAAVFGGPAGPPEGLDVKIVNPLPVPVTGNVNATVSGDVNATVTGEVSVTNVPEVYERIPFSASNVSFQIPGNMEYGFIELDMPENLTRGIAVIEHVSIRVSQKPGSIPHIFSITTATNPDGFTHHYLDLPQKGGTDDRSNWSASETVRLYHRLDSDLPLGIYYGRIGDAAEDDDVFVVVASVSGYIVPPGAASLAP